MLPPPALCPGSLQPSSSFSSTTASLFRRQPCSLPASPRGGNIHAAVLLGFVEAATLLLLFLFRRSSVVVEGGGGWAGMLARPQRGRAPSLSLSSTPWRCYKIDFARGEFGADRTAGSRPTPTLFYSCNHLRPGAEYCFENFAGAVSSDGTSFAACTALNGNIVSPWRYILSLSGGKQFVATAR